MKNTVLEYDSGSITAKLERGEKRLVEGLRFSVAAGESLALIGETGSGKTMTALSVMRLLPRNLVMEGGSIRFLGEELLRCRNMRAKLGNDIVYIPQNGLEFLNPAKSVRGHLYDGLKKLGVSRRELESAALEKLRLAGFEAPEEVIDRYPFQLSGGMAQRVTIALSACSEAKLILADEPTNGLDEEGRKRFMQMLDTLFPGAARLIITHDIGIAALCDRALVLCGGRPMETGPAAELLYAPRQPYTAALLGALVKNGMQQTPVLRSGAALCPFYTRCPDARAACVEGMTHHKAGNREWWCSGR